MRKFIMLASVAVFTAALPSVAVAEKPPHAGGQTARAQRSAEGPRAPNRNRARERVRTQDTDRNRNGVADRLERRVVDRNRDGIDDRAQTRLNDRNRDGIDDRTGNRYGGNICPPGLANRTPSCVPPGQANRMFREGQVIPQNYGYYTPYDALLGRVPEAYRNQIPAGQNYIYRDDAIYVVDPRTRIVTDIINLLRR
jgi:hypothetical protein